VIGQPLPMAKILAGVNAAAAALQPGQAAGHAASRAIMTTDTRPKTCAVQVTAPGGDFAVAGMVKGAGMLHPNLATMLCVLTSDAAITPALADRALRQAVDCSFHRITIDGDTSTNDTVLLLANGAGEAAPAIASADSPAYAAFVAALTEVSADLARAMVRDGEGATRFIAITVRGAASVVEARQVGMSGARSQLVKTAIYGQDANWGRIACAAGYSGVKFDPERVGVWLGDRERARGGATYQVPEARAAELLAQPDVSVTIDLGQGDAELTVWTCDLSHSYVDINAHYRT
jgi:glutamate N-acetyltransferase/amino-acid N-acetyltransferase